MRLGRNLYHLTIGAFIAVLALWPQVAPADPVTPERIAAALAKLEALAEATVGDGGVPGLAMTKTLEEDHLVVVD
ncbi:MAG: serine hydrolase, partial [Mesorhizobium sp.]